MHSSLLSGSLHLRFADPRCSTIDGAAWWLCACGVADSGGIAGGEGHLQRFIQLPRFLGFDLHLAIVWVKTPAVSGGRNALPRKTG